MTKLLVVFGATGNQGGSVIDVVLNDANLSKQYRVRAVTRDPSKPDAVELAKNGAEVVKCDINDEESVKKCLEGADFTFVLVPSVYTADGYDVELRQTKTIVDTFVTAGGKYLIYSAVPSPKEISNGKFNNVGLFEAKADAQKYISTLPITSSFFVPGSFMQNCQTSMLPRPVGDGTYAIFNVVSDQMKWPLVDVGSDTGKWAGAILAEPDKYAGKEICAATKLYTWSEILESLSKATGKTVKYVRVPVDTWKTFVPPTMATAMLEMLQYIDEFGYYGQETDVKVKWSVEQAIGKLTTLDEYLQKNPIDLDAKSAGH